MTRILHRRQNQSSTNSSALEKNNVLKDFELDHGLEMSVVDYNETRNTMDLNDIPEAVSMKNTETKIDFDLDQEVQDDIPVNTTPVFGGLDLGSGPQDQSGGNSGMMDSGPGVSGGMMSKGMGAKWVQDRISGGMSSDNMLDLGHLYQYFKMTGKHAGKMMIGFIVCNIVKVCIGLTCNILVQLLVFWIILVWFLDVPVPGLVLAVVMCYNEVPGLNKVAKFFIGMGAFGIGAATHVASEGAGKFMSFVAVIFAATIAITSHKKTQDSVQVPSSIVKNTDSNKTVDQDLLKRKLQFLQSMDPETRKKYYDRLILEASGAGPKIKVKKNKKKPQRVRTSGSKTTSNSVVQAKTENELQNNLNGLPMNNIDVLDVDHMNMNDNAPGPALDDQIQMQDNDDQSMTQAIDFTQNRTDFAFQGNDPSTIVGYKLGDDNSVWEEVGAKDSYINAVRNVNDNPMVLFTDNLA